MRISLTESFNLDTHFRELSFEFASTLRNYDAAFKQYGPQLVAIVVLLRFYVRADIFRGHQPHLVALCSQNAAKMMCPAARLHCYKRKASVLPQA